MRAFVHGEETVETLLGSIAVMIGYYIVVLSAAMFLIVAGIQIFKIVTGRKQRQERLKTLPYSVKASEEELAAAAIAAVSVLLTSERTSVSSWLLMQRSPHSPWKIAGKSRRASRIGG